MNNNFTIRFARYLNTSVSLRLIMYKNLKSNYGSFWAMKALIYDCFDV